METEDYNPMEASLTHYNYEGAKRKATQEEDIKIEIPPFPTYKKCEPLRNSVGWRNLLRSLRP